MVLKKTPNLIAQLFAAPLKAGGVIHAMSTASRRVLLNKDAQAKTELDLARVLMAKAKRERKAARDQQLKAKGALL